MVFEKTNNELWDDLSLGVISRVRIACITAILTLSLIFILDLRLVDPSHHQSAGLCRLVPVVIALLILFFSYLNSSVVEENYQAFLNALLVAIAMSSTAISHWAGGFSSEYHLGIVEIEFAYVTYIPITRARAYSNVLVLNLMYICYNLFYSNSDGLAAMVNVCIRLFTFASITVIAHHILFCYRVEDFAKRKFIEEKNYELVQQKEEISVQRDSMELMYTQVIQQKQELIQQRDKIEVQQAVLQEAYNEIDLKRQNIVDSINYAKRIQDSVFPTARYMKQFYPDSFLLYLPKDIVSGDFCWIKEINAKIYLAVADCTGHGVPGAFMSVLGHSALNAAVEKLGDVPPNEILNELRDRIKSSLGQTGRYNETKDGMDISLMVFDRMNHKILAAAAYNPLYICRGTDLYELKGDRMPIGIYNKESPFTWREFSVQDNDCVYLFTDGYHSQFGGSQNQKLMIKRFKEYLLEAQSLSMDEQSVFLDHKLKAWMGSNPQIDDILVLGIKLFI